MGNKNTLATLYDPKIRMLAGITDEEIAAIEETIPFSFNPGEPNMLIEDITGKYAPAAYLKKHREQFILKPGAGTHAEGLTFGINNEGWDEAVDKAVQTGGYIAQQFVPYEQATTTITTINADGELVTLPFVRDVNMHCIGGRSPGTFLCRAVPTDRAKIKPLNVATGGGLQPTFVI